MKTLSFESFTKKIYLKAPLQKIYRCWATEQGITSWFLKKADYERNGQLINTEELIKEGDTYAWMWHNWDGEEKGEIIEANGKDKLTFSFAGDCKVTIQLKEVNEATHLTLTQYNIPTDEKSKLEIHYGCSNGWTFWLANLKAFLEHGILLNETEFDLRNEELSGFEYVNM
ncbi:SRPBCC family protein [Abyssalbus ytuae]|uniref:SRPBCC domain-containing protein n=1 Tax=Abyssalbus ytuae TaxID=2926907 RepID=A0A9E7D1F3_9FLAO|nr:SRPBCC domain-containing protein [Abyssalbus ytuae]UOB17033.1 SRPBCC domain-containing protein [Abyssalbus ytuae]